jgi:hypothetical protein
MDGFEQGNLMLIQTIRFYGEKIDEYDREFERATLESGERIALIEDVLRRLPEAVEEASKPGGGLLEKSRSQDEEYDMSDIRSISWHFANPILSHSGRFGINSECRASI